MSEVSDGGTEAREPKFTDLLTPDDSPASDPHDTPEIDATAAAEPDGDAAETRQPAQTEDDDRSPFIPRQRFDEVNTKLKEAKMWREQREWAERIDPQAAQTMIDWFGRATANPLDFGVNLLNELAQHPDYAARIRSEMGKMLGTRSQAQAAAQQAEAQALQPDVEIVDQAGAVVGRTYSDKTLEKFAERIRQQTLAEVDTKYGDKFRSLDEFQQARQSQEAQERATAMATEFRTSVLETLPLFNEHKGQIAEHLRTHPLQSDEPEAVKNATLMAYWAVVGPKLQNGSRNESAVLADLQRKAQASRGVNPGAASSASPKAVSSFFDPTLSW